MPKPQMDWLDNLLDEFVDDYVEELQAEGNDLTKLHQIQDKFTNTIQAHIETIERGADLRGRIAELEDWADEAVDSKPTQYDFRNRIKALKKGEKAND